LHLRVPAYAKGDFEIVGVVADTVWHVGAPIRPMMYFPLTSGNVDMGMYLAVRTATDPLAMSLPVQKQIAALDPELPVTDVMTMQQVIGDSVDSTSLSATLVLAFAVLSLALASVGLYGVLSYLMTQRMTEIGIRIAMGAQRQQVLKMMLADGLRPAVIGLVCGLVVSGAAVRLIQSMLYETRALDPAIYIAVTATLLAVAVLACLVPAWRASRLNPMQALRTE
jgi:putative ABC transport system permease protein